ncbi:MAG: hypothetical protein KUG68_02455, partial [Flavobacteriaceae bacterium]|nr:hypothetical protein [Flavobacteriaceae bacterium]
MKKTLLFVMLLLCSIGSIFSQENSSTNIDELTTRLDNLGTIPGSISEYFTSEELVILKNHFNNQKGNIEEIPTSDLRAILPTKSYTSGSTLSGLGELYRFIGNPVGDFELIGSAGAFEHAGAVDPNDPNSAYVFQNNDDLYHVNLTTGTYTLLGNIPGDWMGAEYSHASGVLYAISLDNNLYTIDTTNVTATLVGSTGLSGIPAALAINGGGGAFMLDLLDDNLYSINLNTGAASVIGPIGFDANFGQGMYWYPPTGEVYLMAFNNIVFDPEFRIVDTSTGQSILISILDVGQLTQYGWVSCEPFVPGPDPQVYNTWYLSEMTVENGESTLVANIFPPISPNMVVSEDLSFTGDAACGLYMGEFMHHESGDFFTIHNFDATLSLCDFDSHNEFENQFYSYFGVNADVLYTVGGTGDEQYFILEFTPGYELIFQNVPVELSLNENELASFKLYPNPVSDQLFIASEHYEIESVIIYSVSGKKIMEIDSIE